MSTVPLLSKHKKNFRLFNASGSFFVRECDSSEFHQLIGRSADSFLFKDFLNDLNVKFRRVITVFFGAVVLIQYGRMQIKNAGRISGFQIFNRNGFRIECGLSKPSDLMPPKLRNPVKQRAQISGCSPSLIAVNRRDGFFNNLPSSE